VWRGHSCPRILSYDINGHVTTENVNNTYTWDANWSTIASIETTTIIHDALGRISAAERHDEHPGHVRPIGKLALMNGQTEIQSFQPFPGGGVFVHRPGSLTNYWRHPDVLGSSRLATTLPGASSFTTWPMRPLVRTMQARALRT
jgi:hypothetical protein